MDKNISIIGIGSSILDLFYEIDQEFIDREKIQEGHACLVSQEEQEQLIAKLPSHILLKSQSGGSICNSISLASALGSKAAFLGIIAADETGKMFAKDLTDNRVMLCPNIQSKNSDKVTGTCVCLISPNAERSMFTHLGINEEFTVEKLNSDLIAQSKAIFLEGYLIANPHGPAVIEKTIELAKTSGSQVVLSLSDPFIPQVFTAQAKKYVEQADLVFSNLEESQLVSDCSEVADIFNFYDSINTRLIMTAGADGAYFKENGKIENIPAIDCDIVDLTGAGDAFAGSCLFALSKGQSTSQAVQLGVRMSAQVIGQIGARLPLNCINDVKNDLLSW